VAFRIIRGSYAFFRHPDEIGGQFAVIVLVMEDGNGVPAGSHAGKVAHGLSVGNQYLAAGNCLIGVFGKIAGRRKKCTPNLTFVIARPSTWT
jgi:hypothetical protein